ncbi:MAG: hypothetical protein COX02_01380 [Candidatus Vogelbacteria bacterium CG22_combo_CG10-13_8_21_14_all_37_9]|uniref:HTH HARE-type domain-containing protein n=1 Tax=Candidatus Vogelbacteria bacterium CG22_combo_CG10-13_8_21_14_all_37_9 TaxID=1975046 RepID=A0A2H0BKP2_9BACT|nr:MAG: hypothetical protein BK005_01545 [bacterium CG10_37_50]PIP58246.1 MAG: hypothetical protein COX02_01380 [Candidatus Vogelbacteria bacterium CG22_combo_CG10-13_8_21_14_all_37_9]
MTKDFFNFKPKEVTKHLLNPLSTRIKEILIRRYGLGADIKRSTLESIGSSYKITRERVRQIENFGLTAIRKAKTYDPLDPVFVELKEKIEAYGGIVHEEGFLADMARDASTKNHLHFLLVISDAFFKIKEDDEFHHRWTTDKALAEKVHESLRHLCSNLNDNDLVSESELIARFLLELKDISKDPKVATFAAKWLKLSKQISENPLGEWGLTKSPNVKMRGIRDYAYLVLRQNGSPMHFSEVAKAIGKRFGRKAHPATCHNELIKDQRFVLVGRGLYALVEWGYSRGTVAEVIKSILSKTGSLAKNDIIAKVLKERHVKENTILVNLQNSKLFKKDKQGNYSNI